MGGGYVLAEGDAGSSWSAEAHSDRASDEEGHDGGASKAAGPSRGEGGETRKKKKPGSGFTGRWVMFHVIIHVERGSAAS